MVIPSYYAGIRLPGHHKTLLAKQVLMFRCSVYQLNVPARANLSLGNDTSEKVKSFLKAGSAILWR